MEASDPTGGMFGPQAMMKLMANPRIAKYFEDPQFRTMFDVMKQNPQMMMQLIQSDPRFMDVFKELTGIDLMGMQEEQMKSRDQAEDQKKKDDEERKKREEEDAKKRKEQEEQSLPEEERQKLAKKKEAEALKNQGNDHYKQKDFENALQLYQQAIDTDPTDITYYTNKAACYFEQKDYDKCIEECDKAIEKSREGYYDYVKLAKALARKANAMLHKGNYDEAIDLYKSALLENNDPQIKDALKKAEKTKKDEEARLFINPEIAEEHRKKGN